MKKLLAGGIIMATAFSAQAVALTERETAIVDIGAWTARGEQDKLGAAFKAGFDAGLTLNEAKELVGQLYAYCGFPRALNAATAGRGGYSRVRLLRLPARPKRGGHANEGVGSQER